VSETRECVGVFGRLFGHCFRPRYTKGSIGRLEGEVSVPMVEALTPQTYECDVCERCGQVVVRSEDADG
jgi:hypothetical protein